MSRQQVISLMGSPMLQDTFHKNRWDYIQAYTHERNPIQRRLLTLYFKGDQLVKIDNSELKEKQLIN